MTSVYQPGAHVTATEPDPYMLERARKRASEEKFLELRQVAAEEFFPVAHSISLSSLSCAASGSPRVLSEIKRVLRPGGELRLYEHVRYQNPIGALRRTSSVQRQWFGLVATPTATRSVSARGGFELSDVRMHKHLPPIPP